MAASMMDISSCAGTLNYEDVSITIEPHSDSDMVHVSKRQKVAHQIPPSPAKCDFDDDEFEEIDLTSDDGSDSVCSVDFAYELPCGDISSREYVDDNMFEVFGDLHEASLCAMWEKFKEPLMVCIGQSPASSCSPTACSTPITDYFDGFDGFDGAWTDNMVSPMTCPDELIEQMMAGMFPAPAPAPAPEPVSQSSCHNGIFEQLAADFARGKDQSEVFVLSESSEPSTPTRGDDSYCYPADLQPSTHSVGTEETFIDPYGVPANAPPCNLDEDDLKDPWVQRCLQNSGVNVLTDFPIVYSPRQPKPEIRQILGRIDPWHIQCAKAEYIRQCNEFDISISVKERLFTLFSYTDPDQPRTMIAKLMEGEPVSPMTKVPTAIM